MRVPTNTMETRRARPGSSSAAQKECEVQIETALRIRPLLRKERDDAILLEEVKGSGSNEIEFALLKSPGNDHDQREYRFNQVFPESTSQDKIYYALGLPIVTAVMNSIKNSSSSRRPKSHLLISMGSENSGKTYTCIGGMAIPKKRATQDGLVPRLLDGLFSQSSHAGSGSRGFGVLVSAVQITKSGEIRDLLMDQSTSKNKLFGASPKKKKNLNVRNMAARFERAIPSPANRKARKSSDAGAILDASNPKPTIQNCRSIVEAREALQNSLSASQKLQAGSFYITMQPSTDGNRIGDRICVLDMAGLEKDNEGIINCLRILKRNSSSRKAMKPVPFRNHKVTMLLHPLFLQSSFVNTTILLAAYPGYTDFQEKQMLLNDVETLTLDGSESATSVRESSHQQTKSEVNNRNERHKAQEDKDPRHPSSLYRRDQHQHDPSTIESRDPRVSMQRPSIATRVTKVKARRDYPQAESIQIPVATAVRKPTARPTTQKVPDALSYPKSAERNVEPSAPAFEEVQEHSLNSKKLKERALDFPGIQSSAPMEESQADVLNQSVAGHHRNFRNSRQHRNLTQREERSSPRQERFVRKVPEAKKVDLKAPLGRSSLENCDDIGGTRSGKAHGARQRTRNSNDRASPSFEADFKNLENTSDNTNLDRFKKLEEQLRKALQEKDALQRTCSQLENENAELRQLSREAGRNIVLGVRHTMTQKEEEEFEAKRKLRLEAQNRIKAPVQEHLDRVNYFYDIKNQWCMTNKKHFSLSYPDHFQRAPVLDIRDREIENCEDLKKLSRNDTIKSELSETNETEPNRSVSPKRRASPPKAKRSPPPTHLSALRRLIGTTQEA